MLFSIWYVFGMIGTHYSFLCIVPLSGALVQQAWWWQNLWVLACSQRIFFFLSLMKLSFAGYEILGWNFFSLRMLTIGPHSLLACRISAERSTVSLMNFPLWVTRPFFLVALSSFPSFQPWWIWRLCALGLLFLRNIFLVFSIFPGLEYWPALLGWRSFPG